MPQLGATPFRSVLLAAALALGALVPAGASAMDARLAALPGPTPVAASGASAAEVAALRGVINRQIAAVRASDAEALLRSLAPAARGRFQGGAQVMAAMRERLPFIGASSKMEFADLRRTEQGLTQLVRVSDARGEPWLAFFVLDKDGAAKWSVANVIAMKLPTTGV